MAVCPSIHDLLFYGSQPISLGGPLLDTSVLTGEAVATPNQDIKKSALLFCLAALFCYSSQSLSRTLNEQR